MSYFSDNLYKCSNCERLDNPVFGGEFDKDNNFLCQKCVDDLEDSKKDKGE